MRIASQVYAFHKSKYLIQKIRFFVLLSVLVSCSKQSGDLLSTTASSAVTSGIKSKTNGTGDNPGYNDPIDLDYFVQFDPQSYPDLADQELMYALQNNSN